MNTINMPGFNADLSLMPTKGTYRSNTMFGRSGVVEIAQGRLLLQGPTRSCETRYSAFISHWFPVTICLTYSTFRKTMQASLGAPGGTHGLPYCRVIYNPFIADVTTTESCYLGVPPSSKLVVIGHPELTVQWTGRLKDIPEPYNAQWFTEAEQNCKCCSGQECPDGRCIPPTSSCDVKPL